MKVCRLPPYENPYASEEQHVVPESGEAARCVRTIECSTMWHSEWELSQIGRVSSERDKKASSRRTPNSGKDTNNRFEVHGHEISRLGIEMIQVEGDGDDCGPAVCGPKG